jgi:hypothetical protein
MILYNYDRKHDWVNGSLDLGEISERECEVVRAVLVFLGEQRVTNNYRELVLARGTRMVQDDPGDEPRVEFVF